MKDMLCALCLNDGQPKVLYEQSFNSGAIDEKTYSARRIPDNSHYRMVRCQRCGLVFSTPIFDAREIERLYRESKFTYRALTEDLRDTYGRYLKRVEKLAPGKGRLLEIGCGNGFFLERALKMGYQETYGVEPSREAVVQASPNVAKYIVNSVLTSGLYEDSYFDVVCFFHTLDHVVDPNDFLANCRRYLKQHGVILCITHNIDAFSARLLGEKCPMVDVEHVYLFNKTTLRKLFEKNGFSVSDVFDVANTFPLWYYLHLLPLPRRLKDLCTRALATLRLDTVKITMKVGNIGIIATKDGSRDSE